MDDRLKDFENFLKSTYVTMIAYCKSRGQIHEDAEEIVDDAYNRMWIAWDKCSSSGTVRRKKWLYNTIDNIIRERNRKHVLQAKDIDDYIDILNNEADDEIKAVFEDMKFDIYIKRIREILTNSEYEMFDQIVIKQQTYREASNELGISEDACRARMMRIRNKIKLNKARIFK